MSSNILEKSDRRELKYFERLKFDQGVGFSCTEMAADSVAPPSVCEFWWWQRRQECRTVSGAKWINEGAATRQRCDRSTSRSLDDVFRNECDEAGDLCFPGRANAVVPAQDGGHVVSIGSGTVALLKKVSAWGWIYVREEHIILRVGVVRPSILYKKEVVSHSMSAALRVAQFRR